jgi:hypothetical protein
MLRVMRADPETLWGSTPRFLAVTRRGFAVAAAALEIASVAPATEFPREKRPIDAISDNSFLLEEAYNQEPGVVQSIFTVNYGIEPQPGPDDTGWNLSFTQEWPIFSQRHQFSYTVPYNFAETGGQGNNGFGDVLLNYRFQAYYEEEHQRAFAPRASLVLPTGAKNQGFSDDTVGAQFDLPFSATWGNRWATHLNAGLTFLPHAYTANNLNTVDYNLGLSGIYAVSSRVHVLLEWTGLWNNVPDSGNGLTHEFVSVLSPGVRWAFNFSNDSQLVLGAAVPVGLTPAAPNVGVFLYVSFEAAFWKPQTAPMEEAFVR